ncbi:MAG TPA: acetyl-CoA carboxylase biotin carboxylase subunit [Bacteroidota bacterium]|nr:acetyl-CoA carboxylase biotin carboxylase subunit [Bacteroidota bacterium]
MSRRNIRKILIANRGEIALRIIRTCKEMGIKTVSVYSEADRTAPHVFASDEACCIGPPPSRESYLVIERIIESALRTGAEAIHPGYGFLSENPGFARAVRESGLLFVGPSPEAIASMGDKTSARTLARKAGVPTVPGTEGTVSDVAEARAFSRQCGYPVLIKAAAGGGGKGMRIVTEEHDLPAALNAARSEAKSSFGDDRVYVEKYFQSPRHIEIQIVADARGNTIHLGERECSIQRRHQKVIEESPSVAVNESLRDRMGETAIRVAKACGYENAGTVEFLADGEGEFYFLEMNTRLQVEHPVTEFRTGLDLVALQIRIAGGEDLPLRQHQVRFSGHAIECRICAEDVTNDFLPSTGTISHLKPPSGPGIREDRGVDQGGEISIFYDSMIAKLISWGETRADAIARLGRALREYELLGVSTNIPLCLYVLEHPQFASGDFTTHFLQEHFSADVLKPPDGLAGAAVAAVCALLAEMQGRGAYASPGKLSSWLARRSDFMQGS